MLRAVLITLRFIILIFAGHQQVVLENAALRQQLAILKRNSRRPRLRRRDRLFWILLMKFWKNWKSRLLIVQPATVVGWHRKRFKRYWWKLSQSKHPGRPQVSAQICTLASANPLYLKSHTTFVFINYRIVLGIIVLVLGYLWNMH